MYQTQFENSYILSGFAYISVVHFERLLEEKYVTEQQ